jgi:hypothetical protein
VNFGIKRANRQAAMYVVGKTGTGNRRSLQRSSGKTFLHQT